MIPSTEVACWELLIDVYATQDDYLSFNESVTDVMLIPSEDYDDATMQHYNLTREEDAWNYLPDAPEGAILREMGSKHGALIYEEAAEQWILDGCSGFYSDYYQKQGDKWIPIIPPER